MATILIIDDEPSLRELIATLATHLGHQCLQAAEMAEGMDLCSSHRFDLVFLDVVLPDGNGLELLSPLQSGANPPEVVVITGKGDVNTAEEAIKAGAWDYVQKPAGPEEYLSHIRRALEYREQKNKPGLTELFDREGIIGESPAMLRCLELTAKAASSEVSVLVNGETGTGKELFAKALHANSSRKDGPFVVVDCAAIPDNLVESMLFGFERGAFTGAERSRVGLIKQADGGTLFLDEVGELPPELQKSFLRVLQEHTFRPIGGQREIGSNFRLVAATNRDLSLLVHMGRFREDLLYRLKNFSLELPPLRKRHGDIPLLVRHAMEVIAKRYDMEPKSVSPDFCAALEAFEWPGNVRELFNILELTSTSNKTSPILYSRHLPTHIRVEAAKASVPMDSGMDRGDAMENARKLGDFELPPLATFRAESVKEAESIYLQRLVQLCQGDMKQAALVADLSLSRLYALLRKHDIRKRY